MGLADLHMHTIYSYDGTATIPAVLRRAHEIGLDVIAITDHDEIGGALEAVMLPSLAKVANAITGLARAHADTAMLARTHGQSATPTTFGKEMNVSMSTSYRRVFIMHLRTG